MHCGTKNQICSSSAARICGLLLFFSAVVGAHPAMAEQGAIPHPKGCADDEIYLSSQDWWLTTPGEVGQDGQPGESFGHLHTELCFPHKATLSDEMTLDVTSIMHNNPGDFYKVVIQIWAEGLPDLSGVCGEGSAVACKEFDPPRTLATCEASGGTLIGEETCEWHDTLTFDTSIFPYDGWQQFRVRSKVDQADGSGMRTSTGLHAYLSNGNPVFHVYENPDRIEGRGWYTDANYAETSVKGLTAAPVSGFWAPWLEMTPGSGGIPVTNHRVALDAAIHAGNLGTELEDGAGPYEGRRMIDTTALTNGWHKLFLRSSQFEPISGSTNSSVSVVFFEVLNQAPPACNLIHLEPVVADSYVRGDIFQNDNFGGDDELIVKSASSDYYTRRAYLRFDIGGFAASSADSALFTAEVSYHQTPGVTVPLKLYSVASDSWGENTITWSNEPELGVLLGTIDVFDVGPVTFDITSHVESELSGDAQVSLVLLDDSGTNVMLRFKSRSVENDPPGLAIVPASDECTPSGGSPDCDNDGVCETGEDCDTCPNDCAVGSAASCGNGVCEAANGEDCLSCPLDCRGRQSGKPSNRFCCGDGDGQGALSCSNSVCTEDGFLCTDFPALSSCCGDAVCEGGEDGFSCELDCGSPPFCGDASCDAGEDSCSCAADCGSPPPFEFICSDGLDGDCDLLVDCNDADCASDPACSCSAVGTSCFADAECCSSKCRGKSGGKVCK